MRAERDPAVVRDVEQLVGIGRPRVGALVTGDEVAQGWGRRSPQAEGAVDVQPGTGPFDRVGDRREVVADAGVHLSGLGADDRRTVGLGQGDAEGARVDRPVWVGTDHPDLCAPDPEVAQRPVDRRVPHRADENRDRRRPGEPVLQEVPASRGQDMLTCRGETGEVSGLAARDERERRVLRDPEQLLRPRSGGVLDHDRGRAESDQPEVLVPGRHQPVRGERDRQRSADHEPEVAAALARDDAGVDVRCELLDHLQRIRRAVGQRAVEHLAELADTGTGVHGSRVQRVEVVCRQLGGTAEKVAFTHVPRLWRGSSRGCGRFSRAGRCARPRRSR